MATRLLLFTLPSTSKSKVSLSWVVVGNTSWLDELVQGCLGSGDRIVVRLPSTWNLCLWSHLCQFNIREYDINTYSYFTFIPLDFCLSLNLFYPVKFVWKRFVFLQKRNLKIQGIFWRFSFLSPLPTFHIHTFQSV